jgi:hypothetical protein
LTSLFGRILLSSPSSTKGVDKKMKSQSRFSKETKLKVFNKSNGRCWYCGVELIFAVPPGYGNWSTKNTFAIEHFENLGGGHISNLVPACISCNSKKGQKTVEEFRKMLADKCGYNFTDNQREYWLSQGIVLPDNLVHTFWFEEQCLQP